MNGRLSRFGLCVLAALAAFGLARVAHGQTVGMVLNRDYSEVYVFDADADLLLATLPLGGGSGNPFDCVVTHEGMGYVSDYAGKKIWLLDLTNPAAPVVTGTIELPIEVQDIAISADQQLLLATGGARNRPLMIVDLATNQVVKQVLGEYQSVEALTDNTVMATQYNPPSPYYAGAVMEFALHGADTLALQGDPATLLSVINTAGEPKATTVAGVMYEILGVRMLGLPGMWAGNYQDIAAPGISAVFSPRRDALYVRSETFIQRFAYDPVTMTLSPAEVTASVHEAIPDFGVEKVAVHPQGTKLYVPEDTSGLTIWDAQGQGDFLGHIDLFATSPHGRLAGICLPDLMRLAIDIKPGKDVNEIVPSSLDGIGVVIYGTAARPASEIVVPSVTFAPGSPAIGRPQWKDFNQDGIRDLRLNFRGVDFGVTAGAKSACLTGQFGDGITFVGCDNVMVVE